jgi:hypothetical protein
VRPEPFTEYFHGTFFYDNTGEQLLVQLLNTVELAMDGEYRGGSASADPSGWEAVKDCERADGLADGANAGSPSRGERTETVLENPPRCAAVLLKLAKG